MLKLYLIAVSSSWCPFLALSILSVYFPVLRILVERFQYALMETGSLFATFSPFILRNILDKTASEETAPTVRYHRNPLSSSRENVSVVLSDDMMNISIDENVSHDGNVSSEENVTLNENISTNDERIRTVLRN